MTAFTQLIGDRLAYRPALIGALAALLISLAVTPLVRMAARRIGAVAMPKRDRWHLKPTAMMGGVAIFASVMIALLALLPLPNKPMVVIATSAALFLLGLVDDFLHLKPYQKLIGQLMAASIVINAGITLPWTHWEPVNMLITLFWLVGITNAVNMLDNMDGLAAGVSALAALFLAINLLAGGRVIEAGMLMVFLGALAGFLVYNSNPASIFMGDCGSMFVGFFLSSTALLSAYGGRSRNLLAVLAVPVLTLFIPIFDTTFVTLLRKLSGRAASQGGRDHTSHRLVALGLSERHAVWMLYAFAAVSGVLSIAVQRFTLDVSLAAIVIFIVALTILGVYLGRVRVYDEAELASARQKPIVTFLVNLSYKRRVFEVLLDVVLMMLSYYFAYALLFGPMSESSDWQLFVRSLPIVVFVKLAVFLAAGVYRGLWRYTSLSDLWVFARANVIGTLLSVVVILFAFRFVGFSRTVFTLDCLILLFFVSVSRFAFRVFRGFFPSPHARTGRRTVIYGAGDGGELLLRELRSNSDLDYSVVAFVDDDPRKRGNVIHGIKVIGGMDALTTICGSQTIDSILVSSTKFDTRHLRHIANTCRELGVELKRMRIDIQPITNVDLGLDLHPEMAEAPVEVSPEPQAT